MSHNDVLAAGTDDVYNLVFLCISITVFHANPKRATGSLSSAIDDLPLPNAVRTRTNAARVPFRRRTGSVLVTIHHCIIIGLADL